MKLGNLAEALGTDLVGDAEAAVGGVKPLDEAGPDDLSFLHNPKYVDQAHASRAGAIIVKDAAPFPDRNLLVCTEPYLAFARALELLHPGDQPDPGIHPSAVVAEDVEIGDGVSIGPCAVVASGSRIGHRSVIGSGCAIGRGTLIGDDCLLHPRVVIEDRCAVGDRCILHSGVVVGSDGYGFATVGGVHHKVPQVGIVVIEDDVELGANVCVDRATMGETRVGRGTKVDNLVQIAHNVHIGEGCLLVAQVGISGSTRIGHHSVFAGRSGCAGHLNIGSGVVVGAKSAVYKDMPDGAFWTGNPARPHREWLKNNANLSRIDGLRQQVKDLERAVAELTELMGGDEK